MKKFLENLAALVKVKTVITFVVMLVFAVLALKGKIPADNAMIIISMVVSFYFGTQHQKAAPAAGNVSRLRGKGPAVGGSHGGALPYGSSRKAQ